MSSRMLSLLRIFCIVYLVACIPRAVSWYRHVSQKRRTTRYFLLGVENLAYSRHFNPLKQKTYGLVADDDSIDQLGVPSATLLTKNGFSLKTTISPSTILKRSFSSLARRCRNLDALLVDLQANGMSDDTALSVLNSLLSFSLKYDKKLLVLDRPNPLGGVIEGSGTIPWRHGLTIGEMAHYLNADRHRSMVDITVIPLRQWRRGRLQRRGRRVRRSDRFDGLPPLVDSLKYVRPLTIVEGDGGAFHALLFKKRQKLSEWESRYLKRLCWRLGLHCFDYTPTDKKHDSGLKLYLKSDIRKCSLFNSLLTITRFLYNRKQITLSFAKKFDTNVGTKQVRRFLQQRISFETLQGEVAQSLATFYHKSKHCCLYKPFPVIMQPQIVKM